MQETHRYDVGPEQGYGHATTLKLTDDQAKAMGLTERNRSKVTTTADSLAKRDRYDEAMTSQEKMRGAADQAAAESDETTAAETKKRGAKDK